MHNLHRTRRDCGAGSISYLVHAGLSGLTAEGKTFFMASMVLPLQEIGDQGFRVQGLRA